MILSYSRRRRLLYFILYASGLSNVILNLKSRQTPLVLMAHRVLNPSDPVERLLVHSKFALNISDFKRRIKFLIKNFSPVSMENYLTGSAEPNSFVLTVDDGYQDNFTHALPVLQLYQVPMHLFITTGFITRQVISWVDRAAQVCSTAHSGIYHVPLLPLLLDFSKPSGRCIGFEHLCLALKEKGLEQIEMTLAGLENLPGVLPKCDWGGLFLSPSDFAAPDDLVSFGAHSVTHPNFRLLHHDAIAAEVEGSRQWLEAASGRPVSTFAYPFGFSSDTAKGYFRQAVNTPAAGWKRIFGTGSGRSGDPLEERRLNLNLQPFFVFHVEVSGAGKLLRRVLRR